MGEFTLIVSMEQLDDAKEKANQLKATLKECQQLIDSLYQDKLRDPRLILESKTLNQIRLGHGLEPIRNDAADIQLVKAK